MISMIMIFIGYIAGLIFFFGCNSLVSLWVLMELNLLIFLLMMFMSEGKNQESFSMLMHYFLIQSFGSVLFILHYILKMMNYSSIHPVILVISMLIKIGLFPTAFWVYQMSASMNSLSLYFLLIIQKIPMFLIFFVLSPRGITVVCLASLIFGSLMIIVSKSLKEVLVSSSIASAYWVFFLFQQSLINYFFFFFFYGLTMGVLLLGNFYYGSKLDGSGLDSKFISLFIFLFVMGLPPLILFFLKMDISSLSFTLNKNTEFFLFVLFNFVGLFGYFKMLFKNITFKSLLYGMAKNNPSKPLIMLSSMVILVIMSM